MTAAISGSEPLATLLCNSAERSIVNGLRETARWCQDNGLHVRLYVFDDVTDQREVLPAPAQAVTGTVTQAAVMAQELTDHRWNACSRRWQAHHGRSLDHRLLLGCSQRIHRRHPPLHRCAHGIRSAARRNPARPMVPSCFAPQRHWHPWGPGAELGTWVEVLREALGKFAADRPAIRPAE